MKNFNISRIIYEKDSIRINNYNEMNKKLIIKIYSILFLFRNAYTLLNEVNKL